MDNNKSCVGGVQYVLHGRYHMRVMYTVVLQSGPAPCLWIEFGDGRKDDEKEAGRAGSVIIIVILLHTDICLYIIIYNNIVIIFVDIILYHNNMST